MNVQYILFRFQFAAMKSIQVPMPVPDPWWPVPAPGPAPMPVADPWWPVPAPGPAPMPVANPWWPVPDSSPVETWPNTNMDMSSMSQNSYGGDTKTQMRYQMLTIMQQMMNKIDKK